MNIKYIGMDVHKVRPLLAANAPEGNGAKRI
jgi:hypothetical protein